MLSYSSPSGQVLVYDPKTKSVEQLLNNLVFANGIVLSDDETSVLVSDLGRMRILRVINMQQLKTKLLNFN